MAKIVSYAFRRRRQPKQKKVVLALAVPAIARGRPRVTGFRRSEEDQGREVSPEEQERLADLVRRMMRPR